MAAHFLSLGLMIALMCSISSASSDPTRLQDKHVADLNGPVYSDMNPIPETKCSCIEELILNRENFPTGFIFGAASSAYQCEGGFDENGKGQSMWDNFTHMYPDKMVDHSNGNVATDSYHLYREDVKIAKDLGLDSYRISISWSRILPGGKIVSGVNQDGIDYYNNLIDELISNGIEPFVTILHFDLPQALQDAYGGFLSTQIVVDIMDFANILFREFGDRVKYWITINDPWTFSAYGYALGLLAPARCSDWQSDLNCTGGDSAFEPYFVAHNQLLAHSAIVGLYRDKYQKLQNGKIGITLSSNWFEPYDDKIENLEAQDRAFDFMLGWFLEPLTRGEYPRSMRIRVGARLPEFTEEERNMIKGSFDFLGFNYYGAMYALHKPNSNLPAFSLITGERNGKAIGEQGRNSSIIYIYPKGLKEILLYIKGRYNNPLVYITENGVDEERNDTLKISDALKDEMRKDYIKDHLCCLHESIKEHGVNVKGYFVWSLIDNFEWNCGFSVRFGLHYVDYSDKLLKRYTKHSALWFKGFLSSHEKQQLQDSVMTVKSVKKILRLHAVP